MHPQQPKKHQLQQKLQTSQSFYKEMLKAEENYKALKNLSSVNEILLTKFESDKKPPIDTFFVYGIYINQEKVSMDLVTQYFVTVFPKPKRPYIFVYFNDECPNNFSNFKNMLSIMPVEYFLQLEAIYLVRPSLRMKASKYFTFGTIFKYLNNKTINIDTMAQLSERINVKKHDILKFLPLEVRASFTEEEEQTQVYLVPQGLTMSKSSGPMSKSGGTPTNSTKPLTVSQKPSSHIQQPVSTQSKVVLPQQPPKLQIEQYTKSERGIPQVFQVLLHYFREHIHELQQQGIFRKSVSIQDETIALEKIQKKQYDYIEKVKDPHLVANLIKRFLSKLKTPIIPYNIFEQLMNTPNLSPEYIGQKMKQLYAQHTTKYLTLMVLLDFLIRKVIPRAHKNNMPLQNVAICFAPCLMWAEQRSMKDLAYMNKSVAVVMHMINNFQAIFGTQKDINKIFRSSFYEQQKKNIVETYNIEEPPHHTVSVEDQRKTPNFGLLMLQKTQSQLKRLSQHSDEPTNEDKNTNPNKGMQINILSPTITTQQQMSPNRMGSRSHIQKSQLAQDQMLLLNQKQRTNQRKGSLNKYEPGNSILVEPVRASKMMNLNQIDSPKTPGVGQLPKQRISHLKDSTDINSIHSSNK